MKKNLPDSVDKICAYCEHAVIINESDMCICVHEGAVRSEGVCRRFTLDLLKIAPVPRALPLDGETEFVEI